MTDDRLIEITQKDHPDRQAFLFVTQILINESPQNKPHLTHVFIKGFYAYATSGATVRRAELSVDYPDGFYRVFKKAAKNIILYRTDIDPSNYPNAESILNHENAAHTGQVNIGESYYHGHAAIMKAIKGQEAFNAEYLKGAMGVYELYLRDDRFLVLDNDDFTIAMAPVLTKMDLPLG